MLNPVVVTLAGKKLEMKEPVFKDLKVILWLYNAIPNAEQVQQIEYLKKLLAVFFADKAPSLRLISTDELTAFLNAIPAACGLDAANGAGKSGGEIDWGYLYGHLCASLGWDYDYVDSHMTMSRLKEINSYWLAHPPTHLLVAAFMGYEKKEQDSVKAFWSAMKAKAGRR